MHKIISIHDLPKNATMADVVVKLGIFPSLTQARKNGFNGQILLGKQTVTKRKILFEIVDHKIENNEINLSNKNQSETPGFWCNWVPPKNAVSHAIQFPLNDPLWKERVISAFFRDENNLRKLKNVD